MAHTPEKVEQYVCADCQVVHAATIEHTEEGHRYHEPKACGACGNAEFVTIENWAHYHE